MASKLYSMTPKEIVAELDKYIIGQDEAKKSVALALRNRYRRSLLSEEMREEITYADDGTYRLREDRNCQKVGKTYGCTFRKS